MILYTRSLILKTINYELRYSRHDRNRLWFVWNPHLNSSLTIMYSTLQNWCDVSVTHSIRFAFAVIYEIFYAIRAKVNLRMTFSLAKQKRKWLLDRMLEIQIKLCLFDFYGYKTIYRQIQSIFWWNIQNKYGL